MLYPMPALTVDDVRVLDEIDGMRRALRHLIQDMPARWTSGLRKFLTADAIAASNSIEGFRVSTVDVADLMEGEHDVDVSEENLAETVAYQHMMTYIQTLHDAPDFAYSTGSSTRCTGCFRDTGTAGASQPASGGRDRSTSPTRATRLSPLTPDPKQGKSPR